MNPDATPIHDLRRRLFALACFGIVFGYVEAAAVVYIRAAIDPIHHRLFPDRDPSDLFPLISAEQWSHESPATHMVFLEVSREVSTVLLTVVVALAVSQNVRQWFASFMLAFGVWDVFYYLWLRLLLGWPRTFGDWDLVLAFPLPWVGPVWAPLVVSGVMIATACVFFWCESSARPLRPQAIHWIAVLTGMLVTMASFWWDARSILANGVPEWFNWPLLLTGIMIGLAGFLHAVYRRG